MATLTATANAASASVTVNGGSLTVGQLVYIFRRDSAGVQLVRDAAEGLVAGSGGTVSAVDYEARQGENTDYLLTDGDGSLLEFTSVAVPAWGTWLKAPALPALNVRVWLTRVSDVSRPAAREVVRIEGSDLDVVLSQPRGSRRGSLIVSTLDEDAASAVRAILAGGQTVMVDTAAAHGVSWRYVSVGDLTETRPMAVDGELGLQFAHRSWVLSDLIEVGPPIGPTMIQPGWTYETIPTLFGAYAALPAEFADYTALAVGPSA